MDFSLSDEQISFNELVATILTNECDTDVVRAGWPGGNRDVVTRLMGTLGELGIFGLLVEERHGGLGLSSEYVVPALQPVGAAAVPAAVTDIVTIVAPALASANDPRTRDVLTGKINVACGVGRTGPVPFAASADVLLIDDGRAIVAYEADEVSTEPVETVDGALMSAKVTPRGKGVALANHLLRRRLIANATLGTAAELLGLGERLLAMSTDYVSTREQFGVPVGSFQAVKHRLADVRLALSFARPLALRAGSAMATTGCLDDAEQLVARAKIAANKAAYASATASLQCHGAMAYTTEYDYHLFAKRVWALVADRGDVAHHISVVADALGLPQQYQPASARTVEPSIQGLGI